MSIDKAMVLRHFNRGAASYDSVSEVQRQMAADLLVTCLARLPSSTTSTPTAPLRVLELGCGTGELTDALIRTLPVPRLTALDLSPTMVQRAQERLGAPRAATVDWQVADAEPWLANAAAAAARNTATGYDVIVSSATFQWFADPLGAARHAVASLRPGGTLGISTFGPDTFHELRTAFAAAEVALGLPPGEHTLSFVAPDAWRSTLAPLVAAPAPAYPAAGGETPTAPECLSLHESRIVRRFATVPDFLRVIRRCGANLGDARPRTSRALFQALLAAYERQRDPADGLLPATFHAVQIVATRPAGR